MEGVDVIEAMGNAQQSVTKREEKEKRRSKERSLFEGNNIRLQLIIIELQFFPYSISPFSALERF